MNKNGVLSLLVLLIFTFSCEDEKLDSAESSVIINDDLLVLNEEFSGYEIIEPKEDGHLYNNKTKIMILLKYDSYYMSFQGPLFLKDTIKFTYGIGLEESFSGIICHSEDKNIIEDIPTCYISKNGILWGLHIDEGKLTGQFSLVAIDEMNRTELTLKSGKFKIDKKEFSLGVFVLELKYPDNCVDSSSM